MAILIMPATGSFGVADGIGAPWDSVMVAIIGAVALFRGVRKAQRYLATHPAAEPELAPTVSR